MPETPRKSMLDSFFLDKLSESQSSFNSKDQQKYKSSIMSHLRDDNLFHTNNNKNIRYVKTNKGGLINYIPVDDQNCHQNESSFIEPKKSTKDPVFSSSGIPYNNNHLKIKLNNPGNVQKRNSSVLQNSFS